MARVRRTRDEAKAAPRKRRITAPVDDEVFRRAGAAAKMRGVTLGVVVNEALARYLSGCYWVDRERERDGAPVAGVAAQIAGADGTAPPAQADAA